MGSREGRTARSGDEPAAGQPLPQPVGLAQATSRDGDGPLRGRLGRPVSRPAERTASDGNDPAMDGQRGIGTKPTKEPDHGSDRGGKSLRLLRLPVLVWT